MLETLKIEYNKIKLIKKNLRYRADVLKQKKKML